MTTGARQTHLWIFNHYAAGPDQGAGTRHFDLARELVASGWRVTIFAAGFNHFSRREERLSSWQMFRSHEWDGVRFIWVRTIPYRRNDLRRVLNIISYFYAVLIVQTRYRAPTHIIGSTVHPLAAASAYLVARLRHAPFFFEIRDLWPQTLVDLGVMRYDSFVATVLWWLETYLVNHSAGVITVLGRMREYLLSRGLRARSVTYVPNGVSVTTGGSSAGQLAEKLRNEIERGRSRGRFYCAYAGAHGAANQLDVVLDAAAELQRRGASDVSILMLGDGPDKPRLMKRVRAEGLDNVAMKQPVAKSDIRAVLEVVDACLLHVRRNPVHRYGVSFNKLFDYMAAGKPVVFAGDVEDDPVALAHAGLNVPPDNPVALADAITSVKAMTPEARQALGRNGTRYIRENHDIVALARRLEETLRAGG